MRNRKLLKLLITISFVFVFIAENVFAGICFCGKCFPAGSQSQTDLQISSTISKSSSNGGFKSCNFEKGKFLKGVQFSKKSPTGNNSHSILTNYDFGNCQVAGQSGVSFRLVCDKDLQHASPIYLNNLSIRC